MTPAFEQLQQVITSRRSCKPASMNGKCIPDEQITAILELANWAPNHGRTEPWRFFVYGGAALQDFCLQHATLYQENTLPESFNPAKFNNLLNQYTTVSHIIAVVMKRTQPTGIPMLEEYAATAAAIQNMLLGAEALGIQALWSTGGMTHQPAMKPLLGLTEADEIVALLHVGYSDTPPAEGIRKIPLSEKISWNK
jgi:nitroreductase